MGTDDKIRNKADEVKGAAKENVGRMTGNEDMEAEGKADGVKSDVSQAAEDVKDVFKS